jgi:regulator of sirC expression with transglutaminase-like and TPR domain
MTWLFDIPTPLTYFATLVQSDADFPLLEAAICLAQDDYPELDVQQVLDEVDQLLARLKRRIPADAGQLQKLRTLNQFFFSDLNFAGNVNNFYDPENSYINVVLQTRRAIPISLAVLWIELAQGLGLAASGVAFPGHFLLKLTLPEGQVLIDSLNGRSLSREELAERLEPYRHKNGFMEALDVPMGLYLQAASPRDIMARMLHNLKEIHRTQEDWPRLRTVLDRLIVLMPQAWVEYRDRGLVHAQENNNRSALTDLEIYLANAPENPDIPTIAARVIELKRAMH